MAPREPNPTTKLRAEDEDTERGHDHLHGSPCCPRTVNGECHFLVPFAMLVRGRPPQQTTPHDLWLRALVDQVIDVERILLAVVLVRHVVVEPDLDGLGGGSTRRHLWFATISLFCVAAFWLSTANRRRHDRVARRDGHVDLFRSALPGSSCHVNLCSTLVPGTRSVSGVAGNSEVVGVSWQRSRTVPSPEPAVVRSAYAPTDADAATAAMRPRTTHVPLAEYLSFPASFPCGGSRFSARTPVPSAFVEPRNLLP